MRFMNEDFDLFEARRRFTRSTTPNRLGAALVVSAFAEWTNEVSDGWAYWGIAVRAAEKAIAEIESTTREANERQEANDLTDRELQRACAPIARFMRSHGACAEQVELVMRGAQPVPGGGR